MRLCQASRGAIIVGVDDTDRFATLTTLHDVVQAQMLRDLLEQEGIPVILPGVEHRGMLGAMGAYVAIPLQVPESKLEEARQILQELEDPNAPDVVPGEGFAGYYPEGSRAEDGGPYRESHGQEPRAESPRLKRVAAFISFALPFGTGHLYARERRTGAMLLISMVSAIVLVGPLGASEVVFVLPLIPALDLLGSMRAVERYNERRGVRGGYERSLQVATGLAPLLVLLLALPWTARRIAPATVAHDDVVQVCGCLATSGNKVCVGRLEASLRDRTLAAETVIACAECLSSVGCGEPLECDSCVFLAPGW